MILILILEILAIYLEFGKLGNNAYLFFDNREMITITSSSILIYYIAKYCFVNSRYSERFIKVVSFISSCTFGIYLLSDFFIDKLHSINEYLAGFKNPIIAVIIFQIIIFNIGMIATYILRKIPYINKLLM